MGIDCRGRNVADQEALAGKITYFPASRALPIKYFPYLGQRNQVDKEVGYHSPLVAIQVDPPPRASWCTWSAAPTTAASSTTRRTSLVSFNSKFKSCKERSSVQLQIQLWQTSSSVIEAFETRL